MEIQKHPHNVRPLLPAIPMEALSIFLRALGDQLAQYKFVFVVVVIVVCLWQSGRQEYMIKDVLQIVAGE